MPPCSQEVEYTFKYVSLLFGTLDGCSIRRSPKLCVRNQRQMGACVDSKPLLQNLALFIPRGVKGNCASRSGTVLCCVSRRSFCPSPKCLHASFSGGALGRVEEILRKGGESYWGFGKPVTKEVSESLVLPLESLLSRYVEGTLLTKE